jgi:hypothetical protein
MSNSSVDQKLEFEFAILDREDVHAHLELSMWWPLGTENFETAVSQVFQKILANGNCAERAFPSGIVGKNGEHFPEQK